MHNPICLRTSVIIIKERHNQEPFRQSFCPEQMKSLKLLSLLVPHLSAFFISDNYPPPTPNVYKRIKSTVVFILREVRTRKDDGGDSEAFLVYVFKNAYFPVGAKIE